MTGQQRMLLAAAGSLALLLGAFAFQHLGGMAPCKLCIWQRWPHLFAIACGALAWRVSNRLLALAGALAAATSGVIGVYHSGVEQHWWEGPTSCTSGSIGGLTTDALMDQIMNAPLVRCDDIPWQLFSLSMASWNAVVSFVLVAIWLRAYKKLAA